MWLMISENFTFCLQYHLVTHSLEDNQPPVSDRLGYGIKTNNKQTSFRSFGKSYHASISLQNHYKKATWALPNNRMLQTQQACKLEVLMVLQLSEHGKCAVQTRQTRKKGLKPGREGGTDNPQVLWTLWAFFHGRWHDASCTTKERSL